MKTNTISPLPVIKVLIVDDHQMLRDGLKTMLLSFKKEFLIEITEAPSGEKALQQAEQLDFDLVIVDYMLGGIKGDELIRRLLRFKPDTKVLALSFYSEYSIIEAMIDAGALGYLVKSIRPEQLLLAIQTVLSGKAYYCNEVALVLLTEARENPGAKKAAQYQLTAREIEVLLLIAEGMANDEIAQKLFRARRTIDTHRQNLMKKLKVKNSAALIRFAIELKLLK